MAAVVTQHPERDWKYISLGFPSNFSAHYAAHGAPFEYFGTPLRADPPMPVGDSVQDQYHEQKRKDAHYMVMAGVKATSNSKKHMESFHANYDMPKPLLTQRKYANPSYGSGSADIYTARKWSDVVGHDSSDEDMEGGVRTAKGQAWAYRKLQQKADQIQEMKDNPERLTAYEAPEFAELKKEALASQGISEVAGPKLYLELAGLLNTVTTAIQTGEYDKIVLNDLFKMLKILFRVGATANREELGDLLAVVNENLEAIRGQIGIARGPRPGPGATTAEKRQFAKLQNADAFFTTIEILLRQTHEYLTRMLGSVDKSPKERKVASRSAIKNLQFTRPLGLDDVKYAKRVPGIRREFGEEEIAANEAEKVPYQNIIEQNMGYLRERKEAFATVKRINKIPRASRDPTDTANLQSALLRIAQLRREEEALAPGDKFRDRIREARLAIKEIERRGKRILPTVEADALGRGRPVETGGSKHIRSQLASRLTSVAEEEPRTARLTKDPRATWAARSGAYYGEELPGYPDAFVARSGKRAPKEGGLPTTAPVQALPVFKDKK